MKKFLGIIGVLVLGGVIFGGCAVSGYNKAINLNENVSNQWAQVENVLQRRYDLIPNLVATVKGYASHEKDVFENIAEARTKYFSAGTTAQKAEAATGVERALSRLLVLQEQYPQLKADKSFNDLMVSLEGSENRIATERKRYNDAVTALNKYTRQFFGRMFAGWAGVEPAEYFKMDEAAKTVPKVDFNSEK